MPVVFIKTQGTVVARFVEAGEVVFVDGVGSMVPTSEAFNKMGKEELKAVLRTAGMRGYSKMTKPQLVDELLARWSDVLDKVNHFYADENQEAETSQDDEPVAVAEPGQEVEPAQEAQAVETVQEARVVSDDEFNTDPYHVPVKIVSINNVELDVWAQTDEPAFYLMHDIAHHTGVPYKNMCIYYNGQKIHKNQKIMSLNIHAGATINLGHEILGGGKGMVKQHLKKEDAMKILRRRSKLVISKDLEVDDEALGPLPEKLSSFMASVDEEMQKYIALKNSGDKVIAPGLHKLSDEQLQTLTEILYKKSGGVSEEKILQMAHVVFQELTQIDAAIGHLKLKKKDFINFFIDVYSDEYNQIKSSIMNYNNESFLKDVEAVINFRKGKEAQTPSGNCNIS
jgi:hypothetical protein